MAKVILLIGDAVHQFVPNCRVAVSRYTTYVDGKPYSFKHNTVSLVILLSLWKNKAKTKITYIVH